MAVVLAVVAALVTLDAGRALLAAGVESLVSRTLPGSVKIGRLRSVGFGRPVAEDVEFFDPKGASVLLVRRAEVDFNLNQALRGKLGFHLARADGGKVVIDVQPNGRTTIEDAFSSRSSSEDGTRRKGVELHLENIHAEGMTAVLRFGGETRFVIEGVQGFLKIWREDTPGVRVELTNIQGKFAKPNITGDSIDLQRLDGWVHGKEKHVVSMEFSTEIGDGALDGNFDYFKRKEKPVELRIRPKPGSGATLTALSIKVKSWFSDKLSVDVDVADGGE